MNAWVNLEDAANQLRAVGFDVFDPVVGALQRCKVAGCTQKGWYSLHEVRLDDGRFAVVGAYGWWVGAEKFQHNIELRVDSDKPTLSTDQRAALRKRMADAKREADAKRAADNARAAKAAAAAWVRYATDGTSGYLDDKQIQPHGARFTPASALVIPLQDVARQIHGLQLIYPKGHKKRAKLGRDKDFWPYGLAVAGHFFPIGALVDGAIILVAEGFATGATLFEATGLPTVVAFNAGNLAPVALALRKRYPRARLLICADDDWKTAGNPGVDKAAAAALAANGAWCRPLFSAATARGDKDTDYNDLRRLEGVAAVAEQITQAVAGQGWQAAPSTAPAPRGGGAAAPGRVDLCAIQTVDELHRRYSLVYDMADTVFDGQEHQLVPMSSMRNACTSRMLHRTWMESADKRLVRVREVGFDPAGNDPTIRANLWAGWPTTPKAGACDVLLDLLRYLCGHENNAADLFQWVTRWLAYPIQHPGAKMATALVFHGPQGTGKNLFFETVMAIYGPYGRIVDQAAVEDKFNDWASRRLFLIADEVVARMELYHTKNKLKSLITGQWIRINPKNIGAWDERNHVNLVFLSNEVQPLVLERDDRRYTVIWTPGKLDASFYAEAAAELRSGGAAALHDYLLTIDLGDFNEHTPPPMTQAKADLIAQGMDSTERFHVEWMAGDTPLPLFPCRSEDLYDAYRHWCSRQGISKPAQLNTLIANNVKRAGCSKDRRRVDGRQTTIFWPPGADRAMTTRALADSLEDFASAVAGWRDDNNPTHLRRVK